MVTFIGVLMIGAVSGFMMEQQWGAHLIRWTRQHRMRMRVLRRRGVNPLRAWLREK
jgi:hypothetical protein